MPDNDIDDRPPVARSRQDPPRDLTGRIIASAYAVYRAFGYGFVEPLYRRALAVDMRRRGVDVSEEVAYEMFHLGVSVGFYRADLVAERQVIVEVKTGLVPDPVAIPQLLNYLRAADLSLGLVVRFAPAGAMIKRVVASSEYRSRWK